LAKRIMLTGAGGFVGSHVLRHIMMNTDYEVVAPVTFKHKGKNDRIASALETNPEWGARLHLWHLDLSMPIDEPTIDRFGGITEIWNVASQSHVDRSITEPGPFIQNNVALMTNMLDYARRLPNLKLFLQMSTDEVYGPAPEGYNHAEWDAIKPSNPYSASKAAQEAIAFSYWRTYNLPIVITNTMNIIGEMQDAEKFVPMAISKVAAGEPMTVHVSPEGEAGSRFYLHARNLADAWLYLSQNGGFIQKDPKYSEPQRFHIVGEREVKNDEMVRLIADILDVEANIEPVNFHQSRPGHDLRYALDGSKLAFFGWVPPVSFDESLRKTVEWTLKHKEWLL
jgi:dTDP-glucose 4,6-dehydratase